VDRGSGSIRYDGRVIKVSAFPVGIDFHKWDDLACSAPVREKARQMRDEMGIKYVLLGVDRLDYTKGIPERLAAYERFLETHPAEADKVVFVQIGVPSRTDLPEYRSLRDAVEKSVLRLNERFGGPRAKVIHLITRNLDFRELIPYYVLADVMAVTSLHDGMNLVAMEYVAAKVSLDGVLILSPFTGAARELEHAIQVSPYDTDLLANALARALAMSREERADRMRALRESVSTRNIYDWATRIFRDVRRLHLLPAGSRPGPRR